MPAGRPAKLTSEMIAEIGKFASIGMTWADAATVLGVTYRTIRYWRVRGEKEIERRKMGENPNEKHDIYVQFLHVTLKARVYAKYAAIDVIRKVGMGNQPKLDDDKTKPNWVACAWLLERMYPDEFALASRTKLAELAEQVKQMKK